MNTLIKIIITTVLGFFGPTVEEERQSNIQAELFSDTYTMCYEKNTIDYCSFNESVFKMLKYKIDS